jgi:hypothetical protein
MLWSFWQGGAADLGLLSSSLNSEAPDQTFERPTATGVGPAAGAAIWYDLPTGAAIPLDLEWDAAPGWGPTCSIIYLQDAQVLGWIDADGAHDPAGTQQTITLTSASGDLVLVHEGKYGELIDDAPTLQSGYTSLQTQYNSNQASRTRFIVASGATTSAATQDTEASAIVGIVIREAAVGSSAAAAAHYYRRRRAA